MRFADACCGRCWGSNDYGQLGIGSQGGVGALPGQMGAALAPTELFVVKPGTGMEGLSLTGGNGPVGLVARLILILRSDIVHNIVRHTHTKLIARHDIRQAPHQSTGYRGLV